jgi:hypothetical protein
MRWSWLQKIGRTALRPGSAGRRAFAVAAATGRTVFTTVRASPALVFQLPHFFGEAPERRPWAIKREDRPAAFAGRSDSSLWPTVLGYRSDAYTDR